MLSVGSKGLRQNIPSKSSFLGKKALPFDFNSQLIGSNWIRCPSLEQSLTKEKRNSGLFRLIMIHLLGLGWGLPSLAPRDLCQVPTVNQVLLTKDVF